MLRGTWLRAAVTCTLCPLRTGRPRASLLASPSLSLFLPLSLARSLTLSLPSAARLSRSEPLRSARDESLQWHEFNSTLFILQPHSPTPCGSTHVNSRLHLAGRSARGGGGGGRDEEEEEAREGRRRAPRSPPGSARGGADASHTHPAQGRRAVVRVGTRGPRTRGALRPLGSLRIFSTPTPPPGRSALGLFHWRTLPKMVICVRGRECGFPRFRVTWRERDSLTRSRARRGLPLLPIPTPKGRGTGRGRGSESGRAGTGSGF